MWREEGHSVGDTREEKEQFMAHVFRYHPRKNGTKGWVLTQPGQLAGSGRSLVPFGTQTHLRPRKEGKRMIDCDSKSRMP